NLLAAAQEIDKLAMLFPDGRVGCADLLAMVADSARFNVYDLLDAALAGRPERTLRILNGLKGEGLEPPLILWALHREIRLLNKLSADLQRGLPMGVALERRGVWERRRPLLGEAHKRLDPATCRRLLQATARVDRIAKGAEKGPLWDERLNICLELAGCRFGHQTMGVASTP
ncbi:MAG: DNA polymerase III subunit delta, partial [Candidatus Competibacteraceae bacterium]|nr:DNA polymerase III subunit delta [Candidatus Competibacteraceae bacterium]